MGNEEGGWANRQIPAFRPITNDQLPITNYPPWHPKSKLQNPLKIHRVSIPNSRNFEDLGQYALW